ncbi:unnamed protein product [Dovyalis caffra]|uniref:Uncharacterized protein n=1 Tax=Dovyalis caffra TaxID=77055 RepID=A0AAV1RP42_9ROSI|nr:unnamed protein product [Dovyalis caffra]
MGNDKDLQKGSTAMRTKERRSPKETEEDVEEEDDCSKRGLKSLLPRPPPGTLHSKPLANRSPLPQTSLTLTHYHHLSMDLSFTCYPQTPPFIVNDRHQTSTSSLVSLAKSDSS